MYDIIVHDAGPARRLVLLDVRFSAREFGHLAYQALGGVGVVYRPRKVAERQRQGLGCALP